MQQLTIPTTNKPNLLNFAALLKNRSILYDKDSNSFYVKYDDELRQVYNKVDNKNIIIKNIDGDDYVSLSDDVVVMSTNVSPDDKIHNYNGLLAETAITNQKSIYLIMRTSESIKECFCGEICRFGNNVSEMYHVSVSSNSKPSIVGSSGTTKPAKIKKISFAGIEYYGLVFQDRLESNLYFHGFSNVNQLAPPNYSNYRDNQLTILED